MAVVVPIVADTSGLSRGLKGAGSGLARFGKLAAVAIGVGVTAELYKSVKAAAAAEKSTQALRGQLKSLGLSGDVERLQNQFTQLATTLGVDDEAASRAFTTILRLTGDSTKAMDGLNLALDLSANTGFADLEKNAMNVGRAMNGNTRLFKQFGITVDENTTKQEALAIVSKRVQGQAEAFGGSATGSFQRFNEALENLRENIGGPLVIALANVAGKVAAFVNSLGAKPTLEAKIKFIVGSIGNVVWTGIRSIYTWWDQQGRVELPARVVLTPSGRQQFDTFFTNLERDARGLGNRMGRGAVNAFIGLFSSEGRSQLATTASSFAETFTSAAKIFFRVTGTTLLQQLTAGMLEGAYEALKPVGQAIVDGIVGGFNDAVGALSGGLQKVVNKAIGRSGPAFKKGFAIIISDPIKEAIASARSSLAGLGSSLGDMLATITGKTSPEAKRAAEIRKQQKDEAAAREKKSLEDALAAATTDEDRRKAQQDLDDFLLEQEAQRLEESVANQQEANRTAIDNLVADFNNGLDPGIFKTRLDAILGTNTGTELGSAFASGFSGAITGLTTTIASILAGTAGMQAPAGTEVAAAQSGQQQAYDDALSQWNKDRAERLRTAEEGRRRPGSPGGKKITDAERTEINEIMKIWERNHAKPQKSMYGLAMGGILKKQVFTAGEAGAEAVIPLNSTSAMNMLRDAVGGGGGGTTNVYNLTVNAGLGTDPDELGRTIVESIKRFEKRNGQAFSAPLLSVTQNVAGQTSSGSTKTDFNRVTTLRKG
jgi:hypothetical protein